MSADILSRISEAIGNVEGELTQQCVLEALATGFSPIQVLNALRPGLEATLDTKPENFVAVYEAVKQFGKYPNPFRVSEKCIGP